MKQTLTKIGDALARGFSRERVCEACGNGFSCGASLSGCWCSEVPLSDETRTELRAAFHDCLCRSCLEKAGARQELSRH